MELNAEVRQQLMSLAGITDQKDFDQLLREVASASSTALSAGNGQGATASPYGEKVGIGAPEKANMVNKKLFFEFEKHLLEMQHCGRWSSDGA